MVFEERVSDCQFCEYGTCLFTGLNGSQLNEGYKNIEKIFMFAIMNLKRNANLNIFHPSLL